MIDIPSKLCKHLYKNKVRVLFYHKVNDSGDKSSLASRIFEKQIKYLSRHYTLITLEQFFDIYFGKKRIDNALLLTFDDGYRDNYTFAFPILAKYKVPATIFLTTDFVDKKIWIWHDFYRYIVENSPDKNVRIELGATHKSLTLDSTAGQMAARKVLHRYLRKIAKKERHEEINRIAKTLHIDLPFNPTPKYEALSWDEIKVMAAQNIDFGSHTCSHEILSVLGADELAYELRESKFRIENELNKEVKAFAYPNGEAIDFTNTAIKILKENEYAVAFTTISGMNDLRTNSFKLKRISAGNSSSSSFTRRVSGLGTLKKVITANLSRKKRPR